MSLSRSRIIAVNFSLSVRGREDDAVGGPGAKATGCSVGEGLSDDLDVESGLEVVGVMEEGDVDGPPTMVEVMGAAVAEDFSGFFDLGVRSFLRAKRLPIAEIASPTSRSEPQIVIT